MAKTPAMKPTEAELSILRVLWEMGPATVRQIHDVLSARRPLGYTTTLKMIQIMTEKGLVSREEERRQHVYRARFTQADTQRGLVRDLLDRAFGGSTSALVLQALQSKRTTAEELRAIRKLVATFEKDAKEKP